ncbi:MAG: hypothetical protein WC340_09785 [Kiritimatiellia bacterium]
MTVLLTWFVSPGRVSSVAVAPLLWLSLLSAELYLLLPAVRTDENFSAARTRALKSLSKDPFLYAGVLMVGFLCVQWLNGGCVPEYDVNAGVWNYSRPAVSWLPFSIDRGDALRVFNLMAACVVFGLCLRHAVGKQSKRYLLQWLSSISGVLALGMLWKGFPGVAPYAELMRGPASSSLGSFFGFWMVVGFGAFADSATHKKRASVIIYFLGIICNFSGLLYFAPLPSLILYAVAGLLMLIYLGACLSASISKTYFIKFLMVTAIIIASVLALSVVVLPQSAVTDKLGMTADLSGYWENLWVTKDIRSQAAMEIWKGGMWFGKGVEGYQHYLGTVLNDKSWNLIRLNQGLVYNDGLQMLCEFGLLGVSIFSVLMLTMIIPLCHHARIAWVQHLREGQAGWSYLQHISPFVVTGVTATLCCLGESFVSSPYRLPGLFVSVFIVMLTMPSFLPSK